MIGVKHYTMTEAAAIIGVARKDLHQSMDRKDIEWVSINDAAHISEIEIELKKDLVYNTWQ